MPTIGSHITSTGDLIETMNTTQHAFGAKTAQIFAGSPYQRTAEAHKRYEEMAPAVKTWLQKNKFRLFYHAPYTWNLAKKSTFEIPALVKELELADAMGAEGTVLHMGKSVKLPKQEAEELFVANLIKVLDKTPHCNSKIFVETSTGQGTELFATTDGSLDELVRFYSKFTAAQKKRLKLCVDTCHIFAAGYDIGTLEGVETFWTEWQEKLGLRCLAVIHMNNSAKSRNSHVDRHAPLQHGNIDPKALASFAQTAAMHDIPMIIETPLHIYDIPVLHAMIDDLVIPSIEDIRDEINRMMLGS